MQRHPPTRINDPRRRRRGACRRSDGRLPPWLRRSRRSSRGWYPGSLRSRVVADHRVDEVVGAAVGVAGGAGDVGLAVAAVVSDGGVAQHGGDGGAVAGAGLVSVLAEGDVAGADLTPLPQIVTALHRARPAPTIEDDMDNLAPEAPEAPEAATVTAASFGAAACSPPSCPPVGRGHPATKPPSPPPRPTSPPSSDPTQPTATNSTASTSPTASTTP